MRSILLAFLAVIAVPGSAAANVITSHYTSFYVLGDSLSDDGNITGLIWYLTTGGDPYQGNWRDGGTFTNGDVWNEPLQNDFRNAGRDADNFAVGRAQSSGGNWLIPDLDGQIDKLLDYTTRGDRGANPLVSVWIGGNNIIDAIAGGDAIDAAKRAARTVATGIERLADDAGVTDFLVFNLPNLARIPEFRLFKKQDRAEAKAAGRTYNEKLAKRIGRLEAGGLNVIDIDVYALFQDVMSDPDGYGFTNVKLPCVFPNDSEADRYGQPERCSSSTAEDRLFMDGVHPNALAHSIIGDIAKDAIKADIRSRSSALAMASTGPEPIPNPLPGTAVLLLGALGAGAALGASRRRPAARAA